jgi:hypothetical protein
VPEVRDPSQSRRKIFIICFDNLVLCLGKTVLLLLLLLLLEKASNHIHKKRTLRNVEDYNHRSPSRKVFVVKQKAWGRVWGWINSINRFSG